MRPLRAHRPQLGIFIDALPIFWASVLASYHSVCLCRFIENPRPRHWKAMKLSAQRKAGQKADTWSPKLLSLISRFSTVKKLYLSGFVINCCDLSGLSFLEELFLGACVLYRGPMDNPWPLLSCGSRSLRVVDLRDSIFTCTRNQWEKGVPTVKVYAQPSPPV